LIIKLYIIITLLCLTIKIINDLTILNNITILGYRYDDYKKVLHKNFLILMLSFIPFIRIIFVFYEFNNFIFLNEYINNLINNDCMIIPLTKEEIKNINSLLSIIKINLKNNLLPDKLMLFSENFEENIIYYTIINNKIVIVSSKGPISNKSKRFQYKKLYEELKKIPILINSTGIKQYEMVYNNNSLILTKHKLVNSIL
jgi:hypothetical protein